jgi:hypothetical protein
MFRFGGEMFERRASQSGLGKWMDIGHKCCCVIVSISEGGDGFARYGLECTRHPNDCSTFLGTSSPSLSLCRWGVNEWMNGRRGCLGLSTQTQLVRHLHPLHPLNGHNQQSPSIQLHLPIRLLLALGLPHPFTAVPIDLPRANLFYSVSLFQLHPKTPT